MRTFALFLSFVALLLLLLVADLRSGFLPLRLVGLESGLIVASLALFVGLGLSIGATFLAFLQLRVANVRGSRWLLAWCCALLLGFAAIVVL